MTHTAPQRAVFALTLLSLVVFSGCTPKLQSAQRLTDAMGSALQDADTTTFTTQILLQGTYENFQNLTLTLEGNLDVRNLDDPTGSFHVVANGTYMLENFSVDANILAVSQRLYVKLNSLQSESLAATVSLEKLLNQFIQINDSGIFVGNLDAVATKTPSAYSNSDLRALQQAIGDAQFFTATADHGAARVGETNTRLITVRFDREKAEAFLQRHGRISATLSSWANLLQGVSGDIWISESDSLPMKFHFTAPLSSSDGSSAILTVDGNATYNADMNIAAPKGAVLLPTFLARVLPAKTFQFLFGK